MIHPVFEGVIGNASILRILSETASHPSHAYLFFGPDGLGKRRVANRFARLLLGLDESDASLESHPDFIRVEREEETKELTVKQARNLVERIHLTSARGGKTVVLVEQADRWNEEATNALLKAVEEPPAGLTYLFVAEQPERLPATLRSRLTLVPFQRVPTSDIIKWLEATGSSSKQAVEFAREAFGCPGIADRIRKDQKSWDAKQEQTTALMEALHRSPIGVQCGMLERFTKTIESQDDTESAWREALQRLMQQCGNVCASNPKDGLRIGLGLMHAWHLAGSSLSPRLGIEWAAVRPYLPEHETIPSFLQPSYL